MTPSPQKNQYKILPGQPREFEETPEDDLNLRKRQGERPDDDKADTKLKPFYKFEVLDLEPEGVQAETVPLSETIAKEPKKKRKIKVKTEQEDNTIEIVPLSPEDNDEQIFEITVTSSEIPQGDAKAKTIGKKKVKRMNKQELDDFVTELQEEPNQEVYETRMSDFYEVKLTELPSEMDSDKPTKRILRHEKGDEVQVLEIVESVVAPGEEPFYEINVISSANTEGDSEEITTDKIKRNPEKLKRMTSMHIYSS